MAAQRVEIERGRAKVEEATAVAVEAQRREEATKTELINARSQYALQLAELRARCADELDARCEARCAEANEARGAEEARRKRAEDDLATARKDLDGYRRDADDQVEDARDAAEARVRAAEAKADAAWATARAHETRSSTLVHVVVVLVVLVAALGAHSGLVAPTKLAKRTAKIGDLERKLDSAKATLANARLGQTQFREAREVQCDRAIADVADKASALSTSAYLCVSPSDVENVAKYAADARSTCADDAPGAAG